MQKEKINYILSQRDMSKTSPLSIDLKDDTYMELVRQAIEYDISPEDMLYCILINYMMEEKKKLISAGKEIIIDLYDMYRVEELINTGETYIIVTHGEPVILVPYEKYQLLINGPSA